MKKMSLILVFVLLTAILAGCGGNSELETKISHLDEQLTLLQERVTALETENALLRLQLEELGAPEMEQPHDEYSPIAELTIYDWTADGTTLTVQGFARVMALAKGDGTIGQIAYCMLTLNCNGVDVISHELQLLPGEASDSLELELDAEAFSLSDFVDGDSLELRLEVALTDGTYLTSLGGGWDYADNQLIMIAG